MSAKYQVGQRLCRANGGHITIIDSFERGNNHFYLYRYDEIGIHKGRVNERIEKFLCNSFVPIEDETGGI